MSTITASRATAVVAARTPPGHFWIALSSACALHLLLLWLLGMSHIHGDNPLGAPPQRLQWRWIPPQNLAQPAVNQTSPSREPSASRDSRQPRTKTRAAQEGTLPMGHGTNDKFDASATTPPSTDVSGPHGSSTNHPVQAPLQLQLPASPPSRPLPNSMLGQALNDARGNSPRSRLEDRIAQVTTGNDALQVDVLGEGRKRVHLNGRCLDVHQARISQIDPMNEVSQRAMPGVKRCDQ